jgi:glycosyltransferase involved in cell wall biosynthesis
VRILINASNLHLGGVVQAATSIIWELSKTIDPKDKIEIWISSEVSESLQTAGFSPNPIIRYKIVNTYGLLTIFSLKIFKILSFDRVFTLFGPLYSFLRPKYSIVGFADPQILYPDAVRDKRFLFHKSYGFISKLRHRLKILFFSKADVLVAEAHHVKNRLLKLNTFKAFDVHVVYNSLLHFYSNDSSYSPTALPSSQRILKIGFMGRNYPHKNVNILPSVINRLKQEYSIDALLYVTFSDSEWNCSPEELKNVSINFGSLQPSRCPSFYSSVDIIVLPSLLECFSITPFEAMASGKPVYVSDRIFFRDICADFAYYFDPLDSKSIANCIFESLFSIGYDSSRLLSARKYALSYSSPISRAAAYARLIQS